MSMFELKPIPSTASGMDLLPDLPNRQQSRTPSSALPSANVARRPSNLNALRRSIGIAEVENNVTDNRRRNSVAWQQMSQHLTLQLEQHRRKSELSSCRLQSIAASNERSDHITVPIDEEKSVVEVPAVTVKDKPTYHRPSVAESILEFENGTTEDISSLKTDVHIVPMANLVERFESNLQSGLTDDTVAQHHAKFGENKLTPPPKSSLLWMFMKQILIGFNGILWVATVFAFLSYVSFRYILVKKNYFFHY
jgi:magnesium-transporting ATPase (P-type)